MISVRIDNTIIPSFNKFYAQGIHIKRRSDLVHAWKTIIGHHLLKQIKPEQKEELSKAKGIKIEITIGFKGRKYDVDNCVMYGKLFLDCLKKSYVKDDSPDIITTLSYTIDLKNKQDYALYKIYF